MKIKRAYILEIDTEVINPNGGKEELANYHASKIFNLASKALAAEHAGGHAVTTDTENYSLPNVSLRYVKPEYLSIEASPIRCMTVFRDYTPEQKKQIEIRTKEIVEELRKNPKISKYLIPTTTQSE